MILRSFLLALGQIGDPKFRKVLALGVLLSFALLVAAYALLLWGIQAMTGETVSIPLIGEVRWLDDLLGFASFIFMMVLSFFLMVPVASAITSMFLDDVAEAVEEEHYPLLPPAAKVPFGDALRDTINYLGVLIGANAIAFVIAAVAFLAFPPAWPLIFYGLNGFLLGREYFTLAAMRRIGRERAIALRQRHRGTIWLAGVLMALPLSIPLVGLVIPILGAATFTHIFHALNDTRRG